MPSLPPPQIRLQRRPGDFRRRSVVLLQAGSTTTCCCCLHWIGAGIGGLLGVREAFRRPADAPPIRPSARIAVRNAFWLALLLTGPVLGFIYALGQNMLPVVVGAVLIPALYFVPAGLVAMLTGYRTKSWPSTPSFDKDEATGVPAFDLGCRLAWMTQLYAVAGMLLGYGVMWLIWFYSARR